MNTIVETDIETEEVPEDEEEDAYVQYDIATYPSDLTVLVLKSMWDGGQIIIPEFQRNYVWTIKQASLLIESFLVGLPVPQAFFYIDKENRNLVIDGQQRITTLAFYLNGYFGSEDFQGKKQVFRLTGLSKKSPFQGKRFTDLDEKDQRKLTNSVLRVVNIRQMAPRDDDTASFHIFERLNTGGTPLKPQEIRNCVFHGQIVTDLSVLNRDKNWRKIVGRDAVDKHKRDEEIVLRIFSLFERAEKYEKPMKEFLNISMKENRQANTLKFMQFKDRFPIVCKKFIDNFGEKPFHLRGPMNLAAADCIMAECIKNYDKKFDVAKKNFESLMDDPKFREDIFFNTSDASVVKRRIDRVKTLFKE
ncbi:DUF262 domain-containing protein [Ciceribacter ferrooxidans]|uniref:DUF262 domain-containing protein n=1 Tax=Ciceribacter ferrooxidans TaxID=2509717 RepID=A0A4Q2TUL2_9HYPH|nr:DUF262 domain-containing protein [Ciceribacter ferrooxidans]RYC23674.1 DUF262 domain-containing protein [Ciceribacter ferrooxidans]